MNTEDLTRSIWRKNMDEKILNLIKDIEETQIKTIEILHRIEKKLTNQEEEKESGAQDYNKPPFYYHKDIHGNIYDPKKMSDGQTDFSEEPEKEFAHLSLDRPEEVIRDGDGKKLK